MDIIECYRLLELTSIASPEDIKSSYRRLARRLHPDVNPNNSKAHDQFIRITEAYKVLGKIAAARPTTQSTTAPRTTSPAPEVNVSVKQTAPSTQPPKAPQTQTIPTPATETAPPELSLADKKLKLETYRQLEDLMKRKSLPRAIAVIEALQARLPNDPEIRQWQAIIYQQWGRQLIGDHKLSQAKAYLQKALKTDPHNKSLCANIESDLRRITSKHP
jgi:tetratricopeptide (TPR) repeat protein